jgi:hypothetical protein
MILLVLSVFAHVGTDVEARLFFEKFLACAELYHWELTSSEQHPANQCRPN